MAKEVVVSVKVEDEQFRDFERRYNALSEKIGSLTGKFKQVGDSVSQANRASAQITGSMQNLLDTSNKFLGSVTKITGQFGRWVTLISSTVMMLGAGQGLWGIDRLVGGLVQRQRQAMGVGSTLGTFQAATGAGQQFPGDRATLLQNITKAGQADPTAFQGLQFWLGRQPTPDELKPENQQKLYKTILENVPRKLEQYRGKEAQIPEFAKTFVGGDQAIQGWVTERNQGLVPGQRELRYEQEREKLPQLTNDELKKLDDMWDQWKLFEQAVKMFMAKEFVRAIDQYHKTAEAGNELVEGIKERDPKKILHGLFGDASDWYPKGDWVPEPTGQLNAAHWNRMFDRHLNSPVKKFGDSVDNVNKQLADTVTKLNGILWPVDGVASPISGLDTPHGNIVQDTPHGATDTPTLLSPNRMGGGALAPGSVGPTKTTKTIPIPGGIPQGGTGVLPPHSELPTGHQFASAAQRMSPSTTHSVASLFEQQSQNLVTMLGGGSGGVGGRRLGAVDNRNWQMNRTASLVVRDVPGSNIFFTGTGMQG